MNKIRAWMMMTLAWGGVWLAVATGAWLLGWTNSALLAAEGAKVSFGLAAFSGIVTSFAWLFRAAVRRRIQQAVEA